MSRRIVHQGGRPAPARRNIEKVARMLAGSAIGRKEILVRLPIVTVLAGYPEHAWKRLANHPSFKNELRREESLWPLGSQEKRQPPKATLQELRVSFLESDAAPCCHGLAAYECSVCRGVDEGVPPGTTGGVTDGTGFIGKKRRSR